MNEENIPVITDREELYDKCENMEQLFDKYYLPLLDKHYSKTYDLQQENKINKTIIEKQIKRIYELEQELNKHKRLIENIKQLELYEYDLDYDYEEEPVVNYNSFNMDYYIENWFKVEELEEGVK